MPDFITTQHPAGYTLSTDPARLDIPAVHRWLSEDSYWAKHIPRATVERAVAHSLCFGIYAPDGRQAAFCRVVTDRATFAWLCDVFVLPAHRGRASRNGWCSKCSPTPTCKTCAATCWPPSMPTRCISASATSRSIGPTGGWR